LVTIKEPLLVRHHSEWCTMMVQVVPQKFHHCGNAKVLGCGYLCMHNSSTACRAALYV
jgi:hypothetical protein